jgi:hypothetical protein
MTLSGHADGPPSCALSGAKRTRRRHNAVSASDPKRTIPLLGGACDRIDTKRIFGRSSIKPLCAQDEYGSILQ